MQRNKKNLDSIESFYLFIFNDLRSMFHNTKIFSLS